jgi:hypothetical protein
MIETSWWRSATMAFIASAAPAMAPKTRTPTQCEASVPTGPAGQAPPVPRLRPGAAAALPMR